jgi:hypothetical protein
VAPLGTLALLALGTATVLLAIAFVMPDQWGPVAVGLLCAGAWTLCVFYGGLCVGATMAHRRDAGVDPSPIAAARDHAVQQEYDEAYNEAIKQVVQSEAAIADATANNHVAWWY